ncbi:hypothetical protein [Sphingobacterium siyangense]|uniref:hypothetical protein n=1 Tax=Sphingobacterium siyangense TaxID=459529 RepID=UPI0028AE0953|nr:hypothetical protein [Sphingobacterium siyangense]
MNTDISTLLVFMYRYAVVYFKKALKEGPINTLDEFSFLIVLMTYPSLSKTELVQKLIMEKTSGIEVIKRLLKNELIEEFDNPNYSIISVSRMENYSKRTNLLSD